MSEVPEQQKNVLELMSEMLKEQEEKSPLTTSAIQAHSNSNKRLSGVSSSPLLSSDNDAQYLSESSKVIIIFLKN